MRLAALSLLLVAAGLLVTSISTSQLGWAWASVVVSGLAAAVLVVRSWRSRRARAARSGRHRSVAGPAYPDREDPGSDGLEPADDLEPVEDSVDDEQGASPDGDDPAEDDPAEEDPAEEDPAEEDTDAADVLVVCDLEDEVVVVDEHPRYHLASCTWLASRPAEPVAVGAARELGFTPCARCGPDAELAGRYRRARSG